jgi:hypothetical protein
MSFSGPTPENIWRHVGTYHAGGDPPTLMQALQGLYIVLKIYMSFRGDRKAHFCIATERQP